MATTTFSAKDVQELRQRTGAGMMDCKKALEESGGDVNRAVELLRKKGIAKAEKRAGRTASEGMVASYIHHNGRLGVLVEVNCETDFVARGELFQELVRAIAEHIAAGVPQPAMAVSREEVSPEIVERERRILTEQAQASGKPEAVIQKMIDGRIDKFFQEVALLDQPWVRDDSKTIGELVKEAGSKTGENLVIRRFARFKVGEE
ncbi:MAG TPA: translation elongation factor Ts [Gemmatimonadaceae bacterium]|nr:translation elongation factor Ts [Gemmatimonadaceae bacterium]